jgi:hypothetical protein
MQIKKRVTHLMRGVTFSWRRGLPPPWRGKRGKGCPHPSWAVAPSPIYVGHTPLLFTRWVFSIPYLVSPPTRWTLSEALPKLLATNTWRSAGGGGVLADPFFCCLAGPRAWRRRQRTVRVTEHEGIVGCGALYVILRWEQVIDYVHLHDLEIVKWSTIYVFIDNICAGT